jgi:hypothetical protein
LVDSTSQPIACPWLDRQKVHTESDGVGEGDTGCQSQQFRASTSLHTVCIHRTPAFWRTIGMHACQNATGLLAMQEPRRSLCTPPQQQTKIVMLVSAVTSKDSPGDCPEDAPTFFVLFLCLYTPQHTQQCPTKTFRRPFKYPLSRNTRQKHLHAAPASNLLHWSIICVPMIEQLSPNQGARWMPILHSTTLKCTAHYVQHRILDLSVQQHARTPNSKIFTLHALGKTAGRAIVKSTPPARCKGVASTAAG